MLASGKARFLRFLLAGGVAAGVNVLSRIGFSQVMSFDWAILPAYLCGMVTAWALSRALVFARTDAHWSRTLGRFALVNLVAVAQVWAISVGLEGWLLPRFGVTWHPALIAHVAGVVAPVFTSYLGHARFSFAPARGRA